MRMRKKVLLLLAAAILSLSTAACGKENPSPVTVIEISEAETDATTGMRLKTESVTYECGEYLSADPRNYIDADDYSTIKMYYREKQVIEDVLLDEPRPDGYILFEDMQTGEQITLPCSVQDTTPPKATHYLGAYHFYLQNEDLSLKDLTYSKVYITDFELEYEDASFCRVFFKSNEDSQYPFTDYIFLKDLAPDLKVGQYEDTIIISDMGGNQTSVPITIILVNEPDPGDSYEQCICSDKCTDDSVDASCPVCVVNPAQCIGIEPELYEE